MTRIGLFIIPLAGEGEGERDKADIKKRVVAGLALAICHQAPMEAADAC